MVEKMTKKEILAARVGRKLDKLVTVNVMEWSYPQYPSFNPSTDISAANDVLEKLKEKWDCISLIWDVGAWDIHLENYTTKKEFYLGSEAGETYEKLSEAICRAALLSKREL